MKIDWEKIKLFELWAEREGKTEKRKENGTIGFQFT